MAPCCGGSLGIRVACGEPENIPHLKGTATVQLFLLLWNVSPMLPDFLFVQQNFIVKSLDFLNVSSNFLKQNTMRSKQNEINSADRLRVCKLSFIVRILVQHLIVYFPVLFTVILQGANFNSQTLYSSQGWRLGQEIATCMCLCVCLCVGGGERGGQGTCLHLVPASVLNICNKCTANIIDSVNIIKYYLNKCFPEGQHSTSHVQ